MDWQEAQSLQPAKKAEEAILNKLRNDPLEEVIYFFEIQEPRQNDMGRILINALINSMRRIAHLEFALEAAIKEHERRN